MEFERRWNIYSNVIRRDDAAKNVKPNVNTRMFIWQIFAVQTRQSVERRHFELRHLPPLLTPSHSLFPFTHCHSPSSTPIHTYIHMYIFALSLFLVNPFMNKSVPYSRAGISRIQRTDQPLILHSYFHRIILIPSGLVIAPMPDFSTYAVVYIQMIHHFY